MPSKKLSFTAVTAAALFTLSVHAQPKGPGPDPAKFQAAIQACESNQTLNPNGVTLPTPTPGQRPQFNEAQQQLLQACQQAGIIPAPPQGGHHPASADGGQNQEPPSGAAE